MSWLTLAESDVKQRLSATEFDAVKASALATGLTNAITEALTEITNEVRGYVAACNANQLETGAKIPPECLSAARDRLAYVLSLRLPTALPLNDHRVEANKAAIEFLKDVAACKVGVEEPTNPVGGASEFFGGLAGGQTRIAMRSDDQDSDYDTD